MKISSAEFVLSAYAAEQLPRDGRPQVAFVGRSNVGKSSLMNRLLNRKGLARTSSTPGRTRAVNLFLINDSFYFADLPGYGFAKAGKDERQRWAELVQAYLAHALAGDGPNTLVVQLVDSKVGATPLDVQALEYLMSFGAAVTVVATKIDRISRGRRAKALAGIRRTLALPDGAGPIPVSARTGEGMGELWKEIAAWV